MTKTGPVEEVAMILRDWLSWLKAQARSSRRGRPRGTPRPAFGLRDWVLEDRCLLSSSVLGSELLVNTAVAGTQEAHPAVAVTKAGTVISAWAVTDATGAAHIEARMLSWATPDDTNRDGIQLKAEFPVSMTTGKGIGDPFIAINGNDQFVVTWESQANSQDQSGSGVFARVFAGNGNPLTDEFRVNSSTPGHQTDPSVAWISPDKFVVVWSNSVSRDVHARLFLASGAPDPLRPDQFRVPSSNAGTQQHPEVISLPQTAALPSGGFQVAWSGQGAGDLNGIFSRQFKADGTPVAAQFRVNTARTANETHPVMDRNGNQQIVIAWQAAGNARDRSGSGVFARTFDLSGKGLSPEFIVNETKERNQAAPSVAYLTDGGFVVAWRGSTKDGTPAIYQREFADNGAARFGERLVNATVAGAHNNPEVRAQGPDGYVIAWDGNINGRRIESKTPGDLKAPSVAKFTPDSQGIGLQLYGDPFMASNTTNSLTGATGVLYTEKPSVASQVPLKTITLTNNTEQTIYPILRAANSAGSDADKKIPKYDPADKLNQEYRGYIGYNDPVTGKTYVGLLKGQTITIQVPLVFWDAARIYIATDGKDMFPAVDNLPEQSPPDFNSANPFRYHEFMQDTATDRAEPTLRFAEAAHSGGNGMILWYHGRGLKPGKPEEGTVGFAEDILLDAPAQLTEFTIRDPIQKSNPDLNPALTEDLGPLVNYDVSYVDSMVLPVAMAATNVIKRGADDVPSQFTPDDFGWIGATLPVAEMQDVIQQFTHTDAKDPKQNPNSLLGMYFDGKGYPQFFNPDESISATKLPSGQNVFNLSPFAEAKSSYVPQVNAYMLTSGGVGPISVAVGGDSLTDSHATKLPLNSDPIERDTLANRLMSLLATKEKIDFSINQVKKGTLVAYDPTGHIRGFRAINHGSGYNKNNLPEVAIEGGGGTGGGRAHAVVDDTGTVQFVVMDAAGTYTSTPKIIIKGGGGKDAEFFADIGLGTATVTLNPGADLPTNGFSGVFSRPTTDYASARIMNLWYSWADYYVSHHAQVPASAEYRGKISGSANFITFVNDQGVPTPIDKNVLVEGMQVFVKDNLVLPKGLPGDNAFPLASILGIQLTDDKKKVVGVNVSKLAANDFTGDFTFAAPRNVRRSSEVKTFQLSMPDADAALAFSRSIYEVMDAFSTIKTDPLKKTSASMQIMTNVIGCNVGYLDDIGITLDALHPWKPAPNSNTVIIANVIRDATKSVMRGVADFTTDQERDGHWYPDPRLQGKDSLYGKGTGQMIDGKPALYNVLNINPFVWFVHHELKFSGYGFSVDDDVADVGAENKDSVSPGLVIAVGGVNGLPLKDSGYPEWSFGAQYGPQVVLVGTPSLNNSVTAGSPTPDKIILATSGKTVDARTLEVFMKVFATDKNNGVVGALVNGPGVKPGTRVFFRRGSVGGDDELSLYLDQRLDSATAKPGIYSFFGPVTGSGEVKSFAKNAIKILDDNVFKQLLRMAAVGDNITTKIPLPAPGALFVTGPGVPKNTVITSIDPVNKVVELSQNLTKFGDFKFTFA